MTIMRYLAALIPALGAALICVMPFAAHSAEDYPTRPIRVLVGFAAGGVNDLVARAIATRLGQRLGQQVIVENRPGAGGNIATELVARAAPDGYTMLLGSVASLAMSPALLGKVPFDPINDFAPITQAVGVSTLIASHPTVPARSLKELIALAKKHPGRLNYASPGTGSIAHLSAELFKKTAGIDIVRRTARTGGEVARAGGYHPQARTDPAQCADRCRVGLCGIRSHWLAGAAVPRENAGRHREPRLPRCRGGDQYAGCATAIAEFRT
jgi:tripartite-type tricarboxylate transporter receptor subunit TctC